jgi:hypothetical protein
MENEVCKTWEDYRVEEMKAKTGLVDMPPGAFNMPGGRFTKAPDAKWELASDDAYYYSVSERLQERIH